MLDYLNSKLIEKGYDTEIDSDGIYLPTESIDIVGDDDFFVIKSDYDNNAFSTNNVDDAIVYIEDISFSNGVTRELESNQIKYKKEDTRFFKIEKGNIKVVDGRIYFQDDENNTSVFVNVPQLIGTLQSRLLGEK
ncbi:TPA_asm: hypothetical protein GZX72_14680, partial [Listeria monocytogenes]|nr:hypothetical protein [Listeria monocytogenes]